MEEEKITDGTDEGDSHGWRKKGSRMAGMKGWPRMDGKGSRMARMNKKESRMARMKGMATDGRRKDCGWHE